VLGNHIAQLVIPFGLFAPQPIAGIAAAVIVLTQSWLVLSGNFAWLNLITIVLALATFSDTLWGGTPPPLAGSPTWYDAVVVAVTVLIIFLSYWPARNLVSRRQLMNFSFNPFHLVNTYGAFGSITRTRFEVIIEGTDEPAVTPSSVWKAYEFKGKPGDPTQLPPQVAPYHLRLDWLMWFAAMSSPIEHDWFVPLVIKLLENDRPTIKLLRHNPFPNGPPTFIRADLYRYRFSTAAERRATPAWWVRERVGPYLPGVSLRPAAR